MNPTTFQEALDIIFAEQRRIMIDRQRKYGPNNVRNAGLLGVLNRAMQDKMSRLFTYYERADLRDKCLKAGMPGNVVDQYLPDSQGDFPDESVEDAHFDASNYTGPISVMLRRGWWGLPLSDEVEEVSTMPLSTPETEVRTVPDAPRQIRRGEGDNAHA